MKHLLGMDEARWRQGSQAIPTVIDTDKLINGHMLFAGMSGTGKSYQLQNLLRAYGRDGIVTDVFDVHEELDGLPLSEAAKFSEATRTGFNPLVLNLDPHSGGVRKQINFIVETINRTSQKLGPRQESALKNLILDVYKLRGCYPDNPSSWKKLEITEQEFDNYVRAHDYKRLNAYYPILRDIIQYANRKLKAISTGGNGLSVNALERVESSANKLNMLMTKYNKSVNDAEVEHMREQINKEKDKAVNTYAQYIQSIETGKEFSDVLKYTNKDTLISLIERLESLQSSGVFCSNAPQFNNAVIRVYQIKSLSKSERSLLFYTRAQQILQECMDAGKSSTLRRVILVDEGHLFYSDDSDNPMNRIAKEGRKFGLGLVIGSQSPTDFSEDFLTNCGTICLLGIHEQYWDMACRKLRIDMSTLKNTKAREVLAVKMHKLGEASSTFQTVNVNQQVIEEGLRIIRNRPR